MRIFNTNSSIGDFYATFTKSQFLTNCFASCWPKSIVFIRKILKIIPLHFPNASLISLFSSTVPECHWCRISKTTQWISLNSLFWIVIASLNLTIINAKKSLRVNLLSWNLNSSKIEAFFGVNMPSEYVA